MWLVVEPAGLVWWRSSGEGRKLWDCKFLSTQIDIFFQPFCVYCTVPGTSRACEPPARRHLSVLLAVLWLSFSFSCSRGGRSFNFSHLLLPLLTHWRRSGGRRGSAMGKFTPPFVCCWTVRGAPGVRYVLAVVGRLRNGTWRFWMGRWVRFTWPCSPPARQLVRVSTDTTINAWVKR